MRSPTLHHLHHGLRQAKRRMEEERMAQLEKYREDYEVGAKEHRRSAGFDRSLQVAGCWNMLDLPTHKLKIIQSTELLASQARAAQEEMLRARWNPMGRLVRGHAWK